MTDGCGPVGPSTRRATPDPLDRIQCDHDDRPEQERGDVAGFRQAAPREVGQRRPLPQRVRCGKVAVDGHAASAADSSSTRLPSVLSPAAPQPRRTYSVDARAHYLKELSVASRKTSDFAARADVQVCEGAVLLLRARRKAGVVGEDLAPDVERLLTAASLDLETIPATMRHAVVQLAEHIVQRCAIPVPRGVVDGDAPGGHPQPRGAGVARTDRRRVVPHCQSMRLGRMG